jgi:hypothetical protein
MKRFASLAVLAAFGASASAVPIVYEGTLTDGVFGFGNVPLNADGNGNDNPADWEWWNFHAVTGDVVTIEVNRLIGSIDPVSQASFGLAADSSPMLLITDPIAPAGNIWMAGGDDNQPPNVPGPFGDPFYMFVAPSTGFYSVVVGNFLGGSPGAPGEYSIVIRGITIPGPASAAVFGLGALALRRRR